MDTLKSDLERAIPHFDTTSDGMAALTRDGKQALRRRRARVGGAVTTSGLAVAGVVMAATVMFTQGGQQDTNGATPGGATAAPRAARPSQPVEAEISLASLQKVADVCGELTLDPDSKTLTNDGQAVAASDEANGDGWSAAQYACGPDIIRILQADDRGLVGRYPARENEPLSRWAEDNVERLQQ